MSISPCLPHPFQVLPNHFLVNTLKKKKEEENKRQITCNRVFFAEAKAPNICKKKLQVNKYKWWLGTSPTG